MPPRPMLAGDASHCAQTAARIARWHHQRYDGSGYPGGLAGTDIPLEARIVALADVYDAIRSKRPYKGAKCDADVMRTLTHGDERIGPGAFDPLVFEAFRDVQYAISQTWDCAALRLLADNLRDRIMA